MVTIYINKAKNIYSVYMDVLLPRSPFHPLKTPGAHILLTSHNTSEKKAVLPLTSDEKTDSERCSDFSKVTQQYGAVPGFNPGI